jgi:general secretion pathway protein G
VVKPGDEPRWQGPYLQKAVPQDPWGQPYVYRYPGHGEEFELLSFGKDGRLGGDAENADISYR